VRADKRPLISSSLFRLAYYILQTRPERLEHLTLAQGFSRSFTAANPPGLTALVPAGAMILYLIFVLIPSLGVALTSPIAFWFTGILIFNILLIPLLAIGHAIPQGCLFWKEKNQLNFRDRSVSLYLLTSATEAILFVMIGISYRYSVAEVNPVYLDLIKGFGIPPVMLASWLWLGYVVMGVTQGIMLIFASYILVWRLGQDQGDERRPLLSGQA
jgi:hypothetical protein